MLDGLEEEFALLSGGSVDGVSPDDATNNLGVDQMRLFDDGAQGHNDVLDPDREQLGEDIYDLEGLPEDVAETVRRLYRNHSL